MPLSKAWAVWWGGYLDAYQCRRGVQCLYQMHASTGWSPSQAQPPSSTAGNLALNTNNWFLITFEGDQFRMFRYHHYLHLDTTCTRNEIQHTIYHQGPRKPFTDIQAAQLHRQTGLSDIAFQETRGII